MVEALYKTESRRELAQVRIRPYVIDLLRRLARDETLTRKQVENLYRELRAYHKSRRPFRMRLQDAVADAELDLTKRPEALLSRLLLFEQLDKRDVFNIVCSLLAAVSDDLAPKAVLV